jgi:hypothetical protein
VLDQVLVAPVAKAGRKAADHADRRVGLGQPAFEVILPQAKSATTARPSTLPKSNESWIQCVGIGDCLLLSSRRSRKTTFAESAPRCDYLW